MKQIAAILTLASAIIVGAMVYLVKQGVSLRAESLISPSEITANDANISHGVAYRLFPELQRNDIILVGVPADNPRLQAVADQIAAQAEHLLGQPVHRATDKNSLKDCGKLCWVQVTPDEAQELAANPYIDSVIKPLTMNYFTLNLTEFSDYDHEAVKACENEKRLDFKCLVTLSVLEAQRKMKDSSRRYFFMKRYEDRGNYLMVQKN